MAEEVGIVMSLYDKVSPTLKAISGNTKAFDKNLDELKQGLEAYEKAQDGLVKKSADLKKALAEADQKVKDAKKSYRELKDETSKGALDAAIDEQERLRQQLSDTETAINTNRSAYQDLYKSAQNAARGMGEQQEKDKEEEKKDSGQTKKIDKKELSKTAGEAVGKAADVFLTSALGSNTGTVVSSGLSGAISGGVTGAVAAGVPGMIAGAVVSGLSGLITGYSEKYATEDEAFKSYYSALITAGKEKQKEGIASGSKTAAKRELDAAAGETDASAVLQALEQGTELSDLVETFGQEAAQIADTFSGVEATLTGTRNQIDAAYGESYNATRAEGMKQEMDAYDGPLGEAMKELNRVEGENAAYMENLSEQYTREALSAALLGQDTTLFGGEQQAELERIYKEYTDASAAYENGDQKAGLEMASLRDEAEALATVAYESSEQYQMLHETELDQIEAIRENTAAMSGWRNEMEKQQELSKGRAAVSQVKFEGEGPVPDIVIGDKRYQHNPEMGGYMEVTSNAFGLNRVPYDNYAALLHEGERVLTAREARAMDRQGGAFGSVTVTGNQFIVRRESDIDAVAAAILRRAELAAQGGVR